MKRNPVAAILEQQAAVHSRAVVHDADLGPLAHLQMFPSEILAAVARGEVDLNAWAKAELALRGLDWQGKWVGFVKAQEIATGFAVRGSDGKMIRITVPE